MVLGDVRLELDIHGMKVHLVALRARGTNATLSNFDHKMTLSISASKSVFRGIRMRNRYPWNKNTFSCSYTQTLTHLHLIHDGMNRFHEMLRSVHLIHKVMKCSLGVLSLKRTVFCV